MEKENGNGHVEYHYGDEALRKALRKILRAEPQTDAENLEESDRQTAEALVKSKVWTDDHRSRGRELRKKYKHLQNAIVLPTTPSRSVGGAQSAGKSGLTPFWTRQTIVVASVFVIISVVVLLGVGINAHNAAERSAHATATARVMAIAKATSVARDQARVHATAVAPSTLVAASGSGESHSAVFRVPSVSWGIGWGFNCGKNVRDFSVGDESGIWTYSTKSHGLGFESALDQPAVVGETGLLDYVHVSADKACNWRIQVERNMQVIPHFPPGPSPRELAIAASENTKARVAVAQKAAQATSAAVAALPPFPPHNFHDVQLLMGYAPDSGHVFRREMESFPNCACRVSATVPSGLSPRDTASILLKTFFDEGLAGQVQNDDDSTVLFGYYNESDASSSGPFLGSYTAGSIHVDQANGVKTLTIDVGNADNSQEYTVTM